MTGSAGGTGPSADALVDPALVGLVAENRWLRTRIAQRHLLDLAAGVIAGEMRLSTSDAAEHLTVLAQATGLSVSDLAADIVNSVAGEGGDGLSGAGSTRGDSDVERPDEGRRVRRAAAAAETAETVGEAARTLLDSGLSTWGADSLLLWKRTDDGCLRLAGYAGVGAVEATAWQWIPPAAPEPFRSALADGRPVWLEGGPVRGEPLPGPSGRAARALLPLRRRGRTVGLALVGWPGPTALDGTARRTLVGLLEVAGTVLDTAEPVRIAVPVLVDLLDSLSHPAMLLLVPGGAGTPTVEHLNDEAVTALEATRPAGDASLARILPLVHTGLTRMARRALGTLRAQRAARLPASPLPEEGAPLLDVRVLPVGEERAVVLWHAVGDPGLAAARAVGRLRSVALFQDSLTGGETVWSEQTYGMFGMDPDEPPVPLLGLRTRVHRDDGDILTDLLSELTEGQTGAQTVLRIVLPDGTVRHVRVAAEPLIAGGTVTGFAGVYQDVSAVRRTEAALTATFDRLTALHDQAETRHQLALQLQRAIVPEVPAFQELPGDLVVAVRYRPAAEEYRVGGDWYDVLALPSGKVLVAVGDIAGHGIDSVTGMVALRNAQRALAFTGHSPRRLMGWLNEVTLRTGGGTTATAVCALYDPEDRGLLWSSAGHLPMLLIREGRARLLDPPHDILLGAVSAFSYREQRTGLRPGDTLLLYTDGLIERRHDGLDEGLARLAAEAERLADLAPDLLVDELLSTATGDTDDDTSIVVVRVLEPPRSR
ncbi:SpoIIE family protein phosphatase [Streptomyces sp. NBC_00094]|uniref:SpoIIE family protein phosphatase n=1 Tax=Streptomyces sp. NBC_00094 TaxID=2903620 RepID=UPI0022537167|nr:SpoIIE family protein phosphatase [Streptomyces sp. NBC_00094]MCX5389052.1 SpoIIE family protein phosphatase [Streptomyces sp. NBC_00094]